MVESGCFCYIYMDSFVIFFFPFLISNLGQIHHLWLDSRCLTSKIFPFVVHCTVDALLHFGMHIDAASWVGNKGTTYPLKILVHALFLLLCLLFSS